MALYGSGKFIKSKLDDLRMQTVFDDCNIVLLNCQNLHNEKEVYSSFVVEYQNITVIEYNDYKRLYTTWNDGILNSRSKYLSNSNVDDRLHPDYYERLTNTLDKNPDYDVCASNVYVTGHINQNWPNWSWHGDLTIAYPGGTVGPCPVWRRSLHSKYGLFEDYRVVSDALMWHKWQSNGVKFLKVHDHLALYHQGANLETRYDPETGKRLMDLDQEELKRKNHE